jgi:hypothetical protein
MKTFLSSVATKNVIVAMIYTANVLALIYVAAQH